MNLDEVPLAVPTVEDKWKLLPAFLQLKGLIRQHVESYNYLLEVEMREIMKVNSEVRSDVDPQFALRYLNIWVDKPSVEVEMTDVPVTPHECRLRDLTYASPIRVDVEYIRRTPDGELQKVTNKGKVIGRIPMMLRSNKCVLFGKTPEELAKLKECPYDPGGYFIVKGTEKVFLTIEQLSRNRIIIEDDFKLGTCATCQSSTHVSKGKVAIVGGKGSGGGVDQGLYVKHNSFTENVPVFIVLRAMGVQSDQEMCQLIGTEPMFHPALFACIHASHSRGVFTQSEALDYLASKHKTDKFESSSAFSSSSMLRQRSRKDDAAAFLANVLLCHIPTINWNFHRKVVYIAIMCRRVIQARKDKSFYDDKDYYGNKRLEMAGTLLSLLFEDLFKTSNRNLKKAADDTLKKATRSTVFDFAQHFHPTFITNGFNVAIGSGNWKIARFKLERSGVTQVLGRLAFISTLGMMTRVNSQFEKTRKVSGPRSLQPSQWGMMCPSDTPEGEGCGLVKNLSLMCHVTSDQKDDAIHAMAINLGTEDIDMVLAEDVHLHTIVMLNGQIIGLHRHPHRFVHNFRELRRAGRTYAQLSVYYNQHHKTVYISTDGGRVCRPLIIVRNRVPQVTQRHMDELAEGIRNFDDFVREGMVEWLDVNEENECMVALREANVTDDTTHLEIEPFSILGVVAGLIPYPHHNQSPRNTYQCAMGKQAVGAIATNQHIRIDTLLYLLQYPQRPMVKTRTIELINFENLGAGINSTVAVMSYSGYDIEDASIHNKASIERCYARCMKLHKVVVTLKKLEVGFERVMPPPTDPTPYPYRNLDQDGIVAPGSQLKAGDVLVNKYIPVMDGQTAGWKPQPQKYKGTQEGPIAVADQVLVASMDDGTVVIKILIRETRPPEFGDKFSSRHGQKGVVGLIVPQVDMPFNEVGMNPDMIMNPHGFPSRMTVGKMIELLAGKAGVLRGKLGYGTAFGGDTVEECGERLVRHGFNYTGKDVLYSGITGESMETYVFMGPIYYQRLKHMVLDKMHARSRGPRSALTRQPTEGRSRDGGLRLGEMERDCLIGHGAANMLRERLMISSDEYTVHVCRKCGLMGYLGYCSNCKSKRDVAAINIPYACKLLFQELISMNIVPRLKLAAL